MFHQFDVLTNTRGDSLVGYQVLVRTVSGGSQVPIFADDAGTPIGVVSGIANVALTDNAGNYDFFVPNGTYALEFRSPEGGTIKTISQVPMTGGPPGDKGDKGNDGTPGGNPDALIIYPRILPGAFFNADINTGGGGDDTALIQGVLDTIRAAGVPLEVVFTGVARVTGLDVSPNTTLRFLAGAGLYQNANAGRAMIRNKNRLRGVYADTEQQQYDRVIDHDIRIIGGTFNGNQANQPNIRGSDNSLINIFSFYGVRDLVVQPTRMINPGCYFVHLALCDRFDVGGFSIDLPNQGNGLGTGPTNYNGDGVHLNGPCRNGRIHDMTGRSADDFVALTADDGPETGPTGMFAGNWIGDKVGQGPIRSITIERLKMDKALYGVRILSKFNRVDDIVIRDISGTVYGRAINIDAYKEAGGAWNGDVGKVLVESMKVQALRYTGGDPSSPGNPNPTRAIENRLMNLGCNIEEITFRDCTKLPCPLPEFTHYPWLEIDANSNIDTLRIDGLKVRNTGTEDMRAKALVHVLGLVRTLDIANYDWQRDPTVPNTGSLLIGEGSAAIGVLRISNGRSNRLSNLLAFLGGNYSVLKVTNVLNFEPGPGSGILYLEVGSGLLPETTMQGVTGCPKFIGPRALLMPVKAMDTEWVAFSVTGATVTVTGKTEGIAGVSRTGTGVYRVTFAEQIAAAEIRAIGYGNIATPSPYPTAATITEPGHTDVAFFDSDYVAVDPKIATVRVFRGFGS